MTIDFRSLPQSAAGILDWPWSRFEPFYTDLAGRTITAANVAAFLADWTRVNELVDEIYNRLYVATTVNTADEPAHAALTRFLDGVFPQAQQAEQKLKAKLLASKVEPPDFALPLRKMQAEAALFRDTNLPLLVEEQKLNTRYERIIGAQTVEWEGRELTPTQLRMVLFEISRARREKAWRKMLTRQLADRTAINELWQKMLKLRFQLARNADLPSYRDYRWQQMLRFDYTPENCRTFQQAIEKTAVPAARRIYERRRQRLGVETLRPWDLEVDPLNRPPLRPFTTIDELRDGTMQIARNVSPAFGDCLTTMAQEGLLDLENRKNKAPGAYCTTYQAVKRPFMFQNAVGTAEDIRTMLHEGGHAFHAFEAVRLPYTQQRSVGLEFAEVASMGMELLALPWMDRQKGGFFDGANRDRTRTEQLEKLILFWPYMAVVDSFQHWVYENPDAALDPANCDRTWAGFWQRFMPGVDWSGLEAEMMTGWHRKQHIHTAPFYYVEYGLAQLGAVQVWANALKDQEQAVSRYHESLKLGGMRSLPELYGAAGAKFAFDAGTLGKAVELIEQQLEVSQS
jgi:oligoendopeptidase F